MISERLAIRNDTDLSLAVVTATQLAGKIGFGAALAAKIATAVSELGRNILKYAGRGEIRFMVLEEAGKKGLEVQVEDKGPGIADVEVAMADHFSSSGTLGLGLPGVRRLMDEFEVDSSPGLGTRVTIRKWVAE
jgi:serine/threonine-protein kinase RsbT